MPSAHQRMGGLQHTGDELRHPIAIHQGITTLLHGRPRPRLAAQRPDPPAQTRQPRAPGSHQPGGPRRTVPFHEGHRGEIQGNQPYGRT